MAEHTPGPWRVSGVWSQRGKWVVDSNAISVCMMNAVNVSLEERCANAHLIAAAPELLEALRELWACVELQDEFSDPSSDRYIVGHEVKEAIAKAEGKQLDPQ